MPGAFLNISHDNPDDVLRNVHERLADERLVKTAVGLGTSSVEEVTIKQISTSQDREITLDLISHSAGCVLQLGDWNTSDPLVAEELVKALRGRQTEFKLRAIRLLGCNTATPKGIPAMATLYDAFKGFNGAGKNVIIYGTTQPIGEEDFLPARFHKESFLKKYSPRRHVLKQWMKLWPKSLQGINALRLKWIQHFTRIPPSSVGRLKLETSTEILNGRDQFASRLHWKIGMVNQRDFQLAQEAALGDPREAKGLLAIPDCELIVPVNDIIGNFHRITLLLDGAFLRVYPVSHPRGLIYQVNAKTNLKLAEIVANARSLPVT